MTDGIRLSEVEKAMLSFSEPTATSAEMAAAEAFEKEYDSDKNEAKIAKLIRRAYQRDKKLGYQDLWQRSLAALRHDDSYLLVMLEQAGIKIPGRGRALAATLLDKRTILTLGSMAVVGLAGFLFLIPLRGMKEPLAGDLVHSDLLRGVLFVLWIAMLWGIGHISRFPK